MHLLSYWFNIIAGNIDFSTRQAVATFIRGSNQTTAFITLQCDREVENDEEFDLTLSIVSPSSGVSIGSRSMATAIITDSTSKRLIFLTHVDKVYFMFS